MSQWCPDYRGSTDSILGNGVCPLRLVCLQDTNFLKNAKDGQEHVHAYATFEYNNLKSLVMHSGIPKLGTLLQQLETVPLQSRRAGKSSESNVLL